MDNKTKSSKVLLCTLVFLLFVGCLGVVVKLRSDGLYMEKRGKMEFLRHTLSSGLTENRIERVSSMYCSHKGGLVSWREYIIKQFQTDNEDVKRFYPLFQSSLSFQSPFSSNANRTNTLAVVGERTVWNGAFDKTLWETAVAQDKILFLEHPSDEIALDSTFDYSVADALALWEDSHSNFYLNALNAVPMYITVRGRVGTLADFKTKESFRKMLEYSEVEWNQIQSSRNTTDADGSST